MKRRHDDSKGYERGVRGFAKDENKFREPSSTVWEPTPVNDGDGWGENLKSGHGIDGDAGCRDGYSSILRNKFPDESHEDQGAAGRSLGGTDIFDRVEGQSSDSGSRKVRSGDND
jgi:hypothetical protein